MPFNIGTAEAFIISIICCLISIPLIVAFFGALVLFALNRSKPPESPDQQDAINSVDSSNHNIDHDGI